MAVPPVVKEAEGTWNGISRLHLSWNPEGEQVHESGSVLTIDLDPQGAFATLRYTWEYEGKPQSGQMLIAASSESDQASIGWSDSWHQSGSVMHLIGTGAQGGAVLVKGEYEVEPPPNWGWRIEIHRPDANHLSLLMFNLEPNGTEEWAVECRYAKA